MISDVDGTITRYLILFGVMMVLSVIQLCFFVVLRDPMFCSDADLTF